MKRKSITHLSTAHSAFDTRIFLKQCKSLAKKGFHMNLIITHDKAEMIDGVHIIPLPLTRGRLKRMVFKPFLALSLALKTKADLYHFHDPELIPLGIFLKCLGKKVVYDVHEDVPSQIMGKYWIPPYLRKLVSFATYSLESLTSRFFDGISAATPHIRDIFVKRNQNSMDINNFPLKGEFAQEETDTKRENAICYVGGITKERGIIELIEAIEGTSITLYLAGTITPDSLKKDLEKKQGWKNVEFIGQVGRKKIQSILSRSQIGLCTLYPTPAYIHSLPVKIFEYMNAGLPIIASNFLYWKNLLKDCENIIFVDPLDPKAIRQAITTLMADKERCISLGKQGITLVNEIYNWDTEEKKLLELYKKIGISPSPLLKAP